MKEDDGLNKIFLIFLVLINVRTKSRNYEPTVKKMLTQFFGAAGWADFINTIKKLKVIYIDTTHPKNFEI